jgi:hypothetical protein
MFYRCVWSSTSANISFCSASQIKSRRLWCLQTTYENWRRRW